MIANCLFYFALVTCVSIKLTCIVCSSRVENKFVRSSDLSVTSWKLDTNLLVVSDKSKTRAC